MECSKRMKTERRICNNGKEIDEDDDVSVIAVIGKENDRSLRQMLDGKVDDEEGNRRVFVLSDKRSKMAFHEQLDREMLSTERRNDAENCTNVEILRKIPSGSVVVKKEHAYKDDSDYVKDSTETSSGGSTSGGVSSTKTRKIHGNSRKTRGTTEVRRNPIRVTKKDPDKDFPRPRQRLLSAKRKEMLLDCEPSKRGKSSTLPYMNTRSVTRKMYNVGATYQAPTVKDETEWKEWPVHGMHERPVFHPQVGLAAEYLGRYFTSLDGLSYKEIIDRPEIEVVSVDPRSDYLSSSTEKKRTKRNRSSNGSTVSKNAKSISVQSAQKNKSFQSCMHESFHCVLGYCSQIMTPTYRNTVDEKINTLIEDTNFLSNSKETGKQVSLTNIVEKSCKIESVMDLKENTPKSMEEIKLTENSNVATIPRSNKNFHQAPKTRLFPIQKIYVANTQKSIAFANLKTFQGGQMKIQEASRSSKNPFILVKPAEIKDTQLFKPMSNNVNLIKLREPSNVEETLGELSSIYKNISGEEVDVKGTEKKENKVEFTVTKYLLDNAQQKSVQLVKELNSQEDKLHFEDSHRELNAKTLSGGTSQVWNANEASEIAKILSEYNKSNVKKPTMENQTSSSNLKNIRVKELFTKDNVAKQRCLENSVERNVNLSFPQGKWRRFHLTVEKLKDLKSNANEKRLSIGTQGRQPLYKIGQISSNISDDTKVEMSKLTESVQRGPPNLISVERKENSSTTINNLDKTIAMRTQSLQELLENTAMLYCAATGIHQDDLANYIDSLDATESIQWLESCNNLIA